MIYTNLKKGCVIEAKKEILDSGRVNKQSKQAGACNEILSQQFWWHHTALFPNSGKESNIALGADILSRE